MAFEQAPGYGLQAAGRVTHVTLVLELTRSLKPEAHRCSLYSRNQPFELVDVLTINLLTIIAPANCVPTLTRADDSHCFLKIPWKTPH